jgi:hypothetical protein
MDVIPLDASLVKGSHGSTEVDEKFFPILITDEPVAKSSLLATDIYDVIWQHLTK